MTYVQREALRVAAEILIDSDYGDLEERLDPGATEETQAAIHAEVRRIGAQLAPTT